VLGRLVGVIIALFERESKKAVFVDGTGLQQHLHRLVTVVRLTVGVVVVMQRRYCLVEDQELENLLVGLLIGEGCWDLLALRFQQLVSETMSEHHL